MQLYTLEPDTWVKDKAIDEPISLIWTERYNQAGDVTLTYPEKSFIADLISEGTFLYIDESDQAMLIDTITTENKIAKATGQDMAGFLAQRMFRNDYTDKSSWDETGSAGAIATSIAYNMVMTGGLMSGTAIVPGGSFEVIPNLSYDTPPSGTSITVAVPSGNVYDAVKSVCDLDDLGFKIYLVDVTNDAGELKFKVYRGTDRTTAQSVVEPVIFSSALESFTNLKTLRSIAGYKNVAYAIAAGMVHQAALGVAYASGFVSSTQGFGRRTMMVEATDVQTSDYPTDAQLKAVLDQRARDALANNNYVRMTDGQLVPQNKYVYGTHYFLGDVIELRGDDDSPESARVVEYIRTQDATGKTAYPTLSVID